MTATYPSARLGTILERRAMNKPPPLATLDVKYIDGQACIVARKGSRLVCQPPDQPPVIVLLNYDANLIPLPDGSMRPVKDNGARYYLVEQARIKNLI
jgi:hypothetical protein